GGGGHGSRRGLGRWGGGAPAAAATGCWTSGGPSRAASASPPGLGTRVTGSADGPGTSTSDPAAVSQRNDAPTPAAVSEIRGVAAGAAQVSSPDSTTPATSSAARLTVRWSGASSTARGRSGSPAVHGPLGGTGPAERAGPGGRGGAGPPAEEGGRVGLHGVDGVGHHGHGPRGVAGGQPQRDEGIGQGRTALAAGGRRLGDDRAQQARAGRV